MKDYFPVLKYFNLPNVITTMGFIFGITACYFLVQGSLRSAIVCLFFCSVMDLVDGWFAKKLNQQSDFGRHVDTLVDFFVCVIMPIWIVYAFLAHNMFIIFALIFYCVCGLWRLAGYNIRGAEEYFAGLPVPGAMLAVTVALWSVVYVGLPAWVGAVAFFITGPLMISNIKLKKYGLWQGILAGAGVVFLAVVLIF